MFAYWLGKVKGTDIRQFGDGNPGAVNAFKACGWQIGITAMLLDFAKGFIPVFIIYQQLKIQDFRIIPIAMAIIIGHAFPVFLNFQGGKAITVTFGIWAGLTLWQVPVVLGSGLILFKFILGIKNDAYNIIFGLVGVIVFILIKFNLIYLIIIIFNLIIIVYNHRRELRLQLR